MQHKQKGFTMAISTTAAKFRKTGETLDYVAAANVMAGDGSTRLELRSAGGDVEVSANE